MQDASSFTQPGAEHRVMDLIVDQLEELVVTVIQEVRERPAIAGAIFAAVVGALIGNLLAAGATGKRRSPARRIVRGAREASDVLEVGGLAIKLLQNPLIRGYILSAIENQFKRRMPR